MPGLLPHHVPLVAVSLLVAMPVTPLAAQSSRAASVAEASLQDLVTALSQQIHLRYLADPSARAAQRGRVEAVLEKWNTTPAPTSADRRLMAEWLDASIRSVMPGRSGRLPAAPAFAGRPAALVEGIAADLIPSSKAPPAPTALLTSPEAATGTPSGANRAAATTGPRRHGVSKPSGVARPEFPREATPRRSEWSRHPSAAPLQWVDPFVDDPFPAGGEFDRGAHRHETRRPVGTSSASVTIDLTQLAARVRGYNSALRAIGRRLAEGGERDTAVLAHSAEELGKLAEQRLLLDMYRDALTEEERRALPPSPSAEVAEELILRSAESRLRRLPRDRAAERATLLRVRAQLARR